MKRAGWYLTAGAAAGFAGVLGLHGPGAAAPSLPGQPRSSGTGAAPAPSARAPGPARGTGPAARRGSAAGSARQATGAVVPYGYGELSVTVTVRGNQITAVSVPLLRTAEPYSQQLAQQVIPMLRTEVLAAHSAQIHAVSGATYTSAAYAQSIQSALDRLHVR
jgi:FMN-binding protein